MDINKYNEQFLIFLHLDPDTILEQCLKSKLKLNYIKICNPKNTKFWHNYFKKWFRLEIHNFISYSPFQRIRVIVSEINRNYYYVMKYGDSYINYILDMKQNFNSQTIFEYSCHYNRLDWAKYFYYNFKIDIHNFGENAFTGSCGYGHLEIAKWLYDLGFKDNNSAAPTSFVSSKINIHAVNEAAFRSSCHTGHIEVAKWLYDLGFKDNNGQIDIHVREEFPFRLASSKGHLDVAKLRPKVSTNA